ncbi:MAG: acyl carrier protein [bacterium]|nr:acyl carrier protein [bacterium]
MKMVFEKIKEIIIDELGIDESKVTMDARFREDLGADSLDAVEIIMQIEEEFGVEISEEVIQDMKVIGDIVKYIEENK